MAVLGTSTKVRLYGWTDNMQEAKGPVCRGVFGEMVKLATPIVKVYVGDLHADAMWLTEHLLSEDDSLYVSGFYFSVREYGTFIGTDRSLVRIGAEHLYWFQVSKNQGEWHVEFVEVTV